MTPLALENAAWHRYCDERAAAALRSGQQRDLFDDRAPVAAFWRDVWLACMREAHRSEAHA